MTASRRKVILLGVLLAVVVGAGAALLVGDGRDRPGEEAGSPGLSPSSLASLIGAVRIADEDRPAVGQSVRLTPEGGPTIETRTGPDGTFEFTSVESMRVHELTVEAEGQATVRIPGIVLGSAETRDIGVLALAPGLIVGVEVRDSSDRPLPGAVVEAHVVAGPRPAPWLPRMVLMSMDPVPVATSETGADGRAVLDGLAMGVWTFIARKSGYACGAKARVDLRSGVEPGPIVVRLRPGYRLAGRVLDGERRPLSAVQVVAAEPGLGVPPSHPSVLSRATTDRMGGFVFPAVPAGDLILHVVPDAWMLVPVVALRVPDVDRIDLLLDLGGSVRGVVRAERTGEPIPGGRVVIWEMGPLGLLSSSETVTDEEGRYSVDRLPSQGSQRFDCHADGFSLVRDRRVMEMAAPVGKSVVRDIVVRRGSRVRGTVTSAGQPLAGARVLAMSRSGGEWTHTGRATTDSAGCFEMRSVAGGLTYLMTEKMGYYQLGVPFDWFQGLQQGGIPDRHRIDVPREGEARLDIEMQPGVPVSGRIEGPDGEPVAGATVRSRGQLPVRSAADGTFDLALAPGRVRQVWAEKGDLRSPGTTTLAVRKGEPVEGLVLGLVAPTRIHGRVVSSTGEPLIDPRVTLHRGTRYVQLPFVAWWRPSLTSFPVDAEGHFCALTWATSEDVVIRVEAPGHAPVTSSSLRIVPGRDPDRIDLTLGPGLELEGRVECEGAPVPGVCVGIDLTSRFATGTESQKYMRTAVYPAVAVTDADGRFVVRDLEDWPCHLIVRAPGCLPAVVRADVSNSRDVVVTLERTPDHEIRGTVVFADGRPAAGVFLHTEGAAATTEPDGTFVLAGLAWRLHRVVVGAGRGEGEVGVKTVCRDSVLPDGEPLRIVVEYGETITGRVVDETGRPISWASVEANPPHGTTFPSLASTHSGADGTFRLLGLESGPHTITCREGGSRGSPYLEATREGVASGTRGLGIVLAFALTIDGHVRDESGRPVSEGMIRAISLPGRDAAGSPVSGASGRSGPEGNFRIGGLRPGRFRLTLRGVSAEGRIANLPLSGGEDAEAGSTGLRLTVVR